MKKRDERRKYDRYDTEMRILIEVTYDVRTKVKFQIIDKKAKTQSPQYSAVSRDLSVEGVGLLTEKELKPGDLLYLEVYLPESHEPIRMEGEVRWSESIKEGEKNKFAVGVLLSTVNGGTVAPTIYYDKSYHIVWSAVLEAVLGSFRLFAQKKNKPRP